MPSKNERRNESMAQQIVGVCIPLEGAVVVEVVVESSKSSAEPIAKPAVNCHGVEGEIKGSSKRGLVRDWNAIASLDGAEGYRSVGGWSSQGQMSRPWLRAAPFFPPQRIG